MKKMIMNVLKAKVMVKVLLPIYLLTFLPLTTSAAPAYPFPITITQPDGTELTIVLHGDENCHWATTLDGKILEYQNGFYRVSADQTPPLPPLKYPTINAVGSYFPHEGSPRVLIILAAFPDQDFTVTDPKKSFEQYFNSTEPLVAYDNREDRNICSVVTYFDTVSQGQYTPHFDIYGPVTLPQEMTYYGGSNGAGTDEKLTQLCKDACELVQDEVDFSLYDNDGDGKAELVYVVHAGYGQNTGGPAESMWAKCGVISTTINGTTIIRGGCHAELFRGTTINGIGTFIHEFSHGMGLPDLYITTGGEVATAVNQGMQAFDVMDYGLYNDNGYAPAAYTAWEQEAMGWTTIQPLGESLAGLDLKPLIEGGTAYKIQNPDKENEYIVLENIRRDSLNHSSYGEGLLVYHIDYYSGSINLGDSPNNTLNHPRVAVVPASGLLFPRGLAGDERPYTIEEWKDYHAAATFPGTNNVTQLTDEMELPNYCFYVESTSAPTADYAPYEATTTYTPVPVGHALYHININPDTGEIAVNFDDDTPPTGISASLNDKGEMINDKWYTLDGRCISVPSVLPKGIYIHNGKKVMIK